MTMPEKQDCIFCRIVAGEMGTKVHEDDQVAAFEDVNPQAPNHTLIVPKRHVVSLDALGASDEPLAGRLLATAAALAREKGHADKGYRVVINTGADGGQTVFHLHVHLLAGRAFAWPPG